MNDNKLEEDMVEVFKTFDNSGKGYISIPDLKRCFKDFNENMTTEEFNLLFRTTDRDNDGKIDFDDFVKMMMAL